MNYLRGAFSAGYQYYKELPPINPSTLTGAIDVIVVQRRGDDGQLDLACTPFHVRFGKWQVLRPGDKRVNVLVNDKPIPFNMKIGDAGEAFFVFETEEDVPESLMTSPILEPTKPESGAKEHKKVTRFGAKKTSSEDLEEEMKDPQTGLIEDQSDLETPPNEPDFLDLNAISASTSKNAVLGSENPIPDITIPSDDLESGLPSERVELTATPTEALAPSSLLGRTAKYGADLGSAIIQAVKEEQAERAGQLKDRLVVAEKLATRHLGKRSNEPPGDTHDRGDEILKELNSEDAQPPPVKYGSDVVLDMAGYHSKERSDSTIMPESPQEKPKIASIVDLAVQKAKNSIKGFDSLDGDSTPTSSRAQSPEPTTPGTSISTHRNAIPRATSEPPEDKPPLISTSPPQYSWEWGNFPTTATPRKTEFDTSIKNTQQKREHERSNSLPPFVENVIPPTPNVEATSKRLSTSENKITTADEKDDLSFHFGKGGLLSAGDSHNGFVLQIDGGTYEFDLSLCGDLHGMNDPDAAEAFAKKRVEFREFMEDPAVVHKDELVVRWNERYIARKDSSPILASLIVWRQSTLRLAAGVQSEEEPLSSSDERERKRVDSNASSTAPTSATTTTTTSSAATRSSWSQWRWFSRSRSAREVEEIAKAANGVASAPGGRPTLQPVSSAPMTIEANTPRSATPTPPGSVTQSNIPPGAKPAEKHYVKTLRLTSDQLKALNLKKGANSITFSLSATGVVTCTARIFVWDVNDHIVISDIDGTITKSDALGHVFTMIGRDWTHMGVAKLYTDICRNGYKIMYLTSRAIGQADSTREYLKGIKQNDYQLPEGPVIMSPDRLMASLHREVIMRQPEVFKMACLRDIQRVFGDGNRNPFYAGFGNRITDALSYRSVNVPSGRIFTIDSSGEVKMELLELAGYKSSYIHMTDLVDQMFPPIHRKWAPEYTDVNFWRQPMGDFELPDQLSPPSPTLSARSDASNQTRLSMLRNFSLRGASSTYYGSASPPRLPQDRIAEEGVIEEEERRARRRLSNASSMPGSLDGFKLDEDSEEEEEEEEDGDEDEEGEVDDEDEEYYEEEDQVMDEPFDDDLLNQMHKIAYL